MPLSEKGEAILRALEAEYGSKAKAEEVLFAGKNSGTFTGIDAQAIDSTLDAIAEAVNCLDDRFDAIMASAGALK